MSILKRRHWLVAVAAVAALVPTIIAAQASTSLQVEDNEAVAADVISVLGAAHSEPYYVVIHSGDANAFGGVVGFTDLLPAGSVSNQQVQLNRPIVDGEYLWPMLHTDGNGNNVYDDPATDPPVVDASTGNSNFGGVLVFRMQLSTGAQAPETPAPTAAGTGNAGLASGGGFGIVGWLALVAGAVTLVGAGGMAVRRR